jgi:hypothetical protein
VFHFKLQQLLPTVGVNLNPAGGGVWHGSFAAVIAQELERSATPTPLFYSTQFTKNQYKPQKV